MEEYADEEIHRGPLAMLGAMIAALTLWVSLAGLAVLALLAFRLGFEMAGANPANNFVDFIYDITRPLVQPFQGIAHARDVDGDGVSRPETAIAMGVYLLATAFVMMAISTLAATLSAGDQGPVAHRSRLVRGH